MSTYRLNLAIELAEDGEADSYPAGWLEGAIQHLFDTYNDAGDLKMVRYQFDGMDKPIEMGPAEEVAGCPPAITVAIAGASRPQGFYPGEAERVPSALEFEQPHWFQDTGLCVCGSLYCDGGEDEMERARR